MKIISLSATFIMSLLYVQSFAQSPAPVDVLENNATPATTPKVEWVYKNKTSIMDDGITESISLKSSTYTTNLGSQKQVRLILRCKNKKMLAAYFSFDRYMGYSKDAHYLSLRFDGNKVKSYNVKASTDSTALGYWRGSRARKLS